MKKLNYPLLLNQYTKKGALEGQNCPKNQKKQAKPSVSKSFKVKKPQNKQVIHQFIERSKGVQNKENLHPNVQAQFSKMENHIHKPAIQQFDQIQESMKMKAYDAHNQMCRESGKLQVKFGQCSFEASHPREDLYLVQGEQGDRDLIVCRECSQKFKRKTRINSLQAKSKYSYSRLVSQMNNLEAERRKLKQIQLIEKEGVSESLQKINIYFSHLVSVIMENKNDLELSLMQAYNSNESYLSQRLATNMSKINRLNQILSTIEKQCSSNQLPSPKLETLDDELDSLLSPQHNSQLELFRVNLSVPLQLLRDFQTDFKQSKYFISVYLQSHHRPTSQAHNIIQTSNLQLSQQQAIPPNLKAQGYSLDFQKQIPFNIEYSATEEKELNFSHQLDPQLSRMSSSEQLLIQSLRNHQEYINSSQTKINQLEQKILFNPKTQSSTYRQQLPQQQNPYTKKNFIKNLHIDQNDIDDLACDEDLTLSSSHPIYQNQKPLLPRKSLKLCPNPSKNTQPPLTISLLTSHSTLTQKNLNLDLINPSLISASENKHEISFQMDQNIMIDGNILPNQQVENENLDIISPAFKII